MRRRYRWPWRTLALGAVLFLLSFGTMAEDPGTLVKEALAKLRAPEARGRRLGAVGRPSRRRLRSPTDAQRRRGLDLRAVCDALLAAVNALSSPR